MKRFLPLLKASLIPILLLALVGWFLERYNPPRADGSAQVSATDLEPFLGHLQFLWERYLDMVQLLVTLLTGVIAVSAGMVKFGPRTAVADREDFASGMMALLVGLFCAVMWRIDSELLMEIEIFGQPGKAQKLYALHGISDPFTSSFNYAPHIQIASVFARVFMVGTAVGLLVGLALLSRFAYSNLPAATRQRSGP